MAQIGQALPGIAQNPQTGFEALTRVGIAAKGIVYVLIGVLALMAAFGEGGQTTDSKGAVSWIASQPFGEFALMLIGVGLLGYAAWRFACAFRDTEREGSDAKGIGKRIGYFLTGLAYSSTGIFALRIVFGDGGGGGGSQGQTWTARLLSAPFGMILVTLVGIAVIGFGIAQIVHGWKEKFMNHLRSLPREHHWVVRAGKWGYIARGVVFAIIGIFVVMAALRHDASQVRGVEGALDTLAAQPFGQILLALVAAGLICFGGWSLVESRYRRV